MKILSAAQIRQADEFTIKDEPIASIDLMERAVDAFIDKFFNLYPHPRSIKIICGKGNNGGDGLAIARKLTQTTSQVSVFVVNYAGEGSKDYAENLKRLQGLTPVMFIINASELIINNGDLLIDALLGSGLSRPLQGLFAAVVQQMNASGNDIVSVDSPTGLFIDAPNDENDVIIQAINTITFQLPKLAFLLPQNDKFVGEWHCVDIGVSAAFIDGVATQNYFTLVEDVRVRERKRAKNSHKGTYGSALLVAGSYGMMGAAVLAAKACLRTGVGKLTVHSPPIGYEILQTAVPEAMFQPSADHDSGRVQSFFYAADIKKYQAVAVGPGLGVDMNVKQSVNVLIEACREANVPLVIDADGLNNVSESQLLLARLPENTILTPHPGEFKKLVGKTWKDDFERLDLLRQFARKYQVIVCLKGANTSVALPNGNVHFNSTGNAGMATAGSGDVLTGMILSLLAQGYEASEAAVLGVFQHGEAGDRAAQKRSKRSMISSDIIDAIE